MARRLSNPADRLPLLERLGQLRPDSQRRWGTLDVGRMLAHLADAFRVAMGEVPEPTTSRSTPLRLAPFRWLALRLPFPLPRNAPSNPAFFVTPADEFEKNRSALLEAIKRFLAAPEERFRVEHPLFGTMRRDDWDLLAWRHIDHHLQQFGV